MRWCKYFASASKDNLCINPAVDKCKAGTMATGRRCVRTSYNFRKKTPIVSSGSIGSQHRAWHWVRQANGMVDDVWESPIRDDIASTALGTYLPPLMPIPLTSDKLVTTCVPACRQELFDEQCSFIHGCYLHIFFRHNPQVVLVYQDTNYAREIRINAYPLNSQRHLSLSLKIRSFFSQSRQAGGGSYFTELMGNSHPQEYIPKVQGIHR